jgi:hypothetical protein
MASPWRVTLLSSAFSAAGKSSWPRATVSFKPSSLAIWLQRYLTLSAASWPACMKY